jgi:hypothetical protein
MVRSLASHWHLCLPGVAILFNLWVLRAERITTSNFNDSSVHIAMLRWARYQIDQGRIPLDGWYPNLGMGLPQFTHYQSLPHLIAAYISTVVGTDTTYYWSLYLLLAFWPISVYVGSRLLGWDRWTAAAAALVAPLLVSATSYGYEHTSYMWWGLGMWTQLVGMWLLPLAWGLSWRAVSGRGSYALGALAVALTIACHFLTGYLALLMIAIWVVIKPSELFVRLLRCGVVGGGAALIASWVIIPLLSDSRWQLATQYNQGTFWDDSFGAPKVLGWLFTGQIYDEGRLPVVTVLVAVGIAVCAFRFRKDERARALLGAWALSLLLFFGRPTLGSALKVLPGSDDLLFHRFLNGVHMAGIILAGVGASWLASLVIQEGRRRLPRVGVAVAAVGVAGIGLLALLPAWTGVGTYDMQHAPLQLHQQLADATDGADLQVLIDQVKLQGGGRVYAGSPGNWGAQYDIGFVPVFNVLENQDIDAIGFYLRTSSLMADDEVLFDERNPAQYDLFNIKYLILPADRPPAVSARLLASQGRHTLWQVATSGYLEVVDTVAPPIVANRRNIGKQTAAFVASSQLANHQYPTVAFAGDPAAQPSLTSAPVTPSEAGTVESQSSRPMDGSFRGIIDANRQAVVLLKASYDPGWKLTVDGVDVKTQMIAPALVGGLVSPGRHTILFQYVRYPYYPELLVLGLITLLGLAFAPGLLRRRQILLPIAPPIQLKIPLMPSLAPVRHRLAALGQSLRGRALRARASLDRLHLPSAFEAIRSQPEAAPNTATAPAPTPRWARWEVWSVAAVILVALLLRFHDYEQAPATIDNKDELGWTWSGLTLITSGEPYAWSYLPSYPSPQLLFENNTSYPIVHPWLDEPPLFSAVMGTEAWLAGARGLPDVTTAMIRPVPIVLSLLSLFLLYALARQLLPRGPALLGTILLATAPAAVLFQRQVESEALLTPLLLLALLMTHRLCTGRGGRWTVAVLILACAAAAFTKVPGLAVGVACGALLISRGRWRMALLAGGGTIAGLAGYVAWGAFWDWDLFLSVLAGHSARRAGVLGAFEYITSPEGINHNLHDGWWILGWLGLFAISGRRALSGQFLLWTSLIYAFTILVFGNDIVIPNYGWYRIPVYPLVYLGAGYLLWQGLRTAGVGTMLAVLALGGTTAATVALGSDGGRWLPPAWQLIAIASVVLVPALLAIGWPESRWLKPAARASAGLAIGLILLLNVVESANLAQGYLSI